MTVELIHYASDECPATAICQNDCRVDLIHHHNEVTICIDGEMSSNYSRETIRNLRDVLNSSQVSQFLEG